MIDRQGAARAVRLRAGIAASMLAAHGFSDVRNVPGSWVAWKKAGYATEGG